MRALLFLIGLVLVFTGCAVGALSFYSPGEVILGLNLGLAATLLVGGLIIVALSSVIGAIDELAGSTMVALGSQMARDSAPAVPESRMSTYAAAGAAIAATANVVDETADDAVKAGGQAPDLGSDAVERAEADVRKSFSIEDEQVDQPDYGNTAVNKMAAETAQPAGAGTVDSTSVAARIGAITAGVKAAAVSVEDKFEEAPDTMAEVPSDSTEPEVDAITHATQDAIEKAVGEAAADVVEPAAEDAGVTTQTIEDESVAVEEGEATVADEVADVSESDAADADTQTATTAQDVVEEVETATLAEPASEMTEPEVSTIADEPEVTFEPAEGEQAPEVQDAADDEEAVEPEPAVREENALYVVEETTVRERPARMLSDGTVEAETDAGWMRFENMDHLNEYLDAMSA